MLLGLYERFDADLKQKPYLPRAIPSDALKSVHQEDFWKIIWQGAWQEVIHLNSRYRKLFYERLLSVHLTRDARLKFGIEKIGEYRNFLRQLALRTSEELRIGALAKAVGVNEKTIKSWLSVAETSELIFLLKPLHVDIGKQLVKSPRVYFTDTGFAAFLIGFENPKAMSFHTSAEAFFKTFVITEILKSWTHNGLTPDFYFYRDSKTQQEIDLLIRSEGKLHPVEVKLSEHPKKDAIKNFSVLKDLPEEIGHGAVICTSEFPYGLADNVIAHSVWEI